MKILFISMPSIHASRWINNLKDTNNDLYWFDVTSSNKSFNIENCKQFINWKKRKIAPIKGEYTFSKKFPDTYFRVKPILEITENEALEKIINEINPDIIHSFEMQHCSYPIVKTMNKYPQIKWLYSCWGSDLFYYKDFKKHRQKITNVLKRVNFLHTDCLRDFRLAKELGFIGKHIGVLPGGSGYDLTEIRKYKQPLSERKIILIKGYQHLFGRALNVIQALENCGEEILNYEVVVFGAHKVVIDYIVNHNLPFKIFTRDELSQTEVLELMGKSLLYIGNNSSDGIPNTLLEAIIMNAFPIQSNPGNATSEIIDDGVNGLLIDNPDDISHIQSLITSALNDQEKIILAAKINSEIAFRRLDTTKIQPKIVDLYLHLNQCE